MVDLVVKNRRAVAEAGEDMQPPNHLHLREHVEVAADAVLRASPRLMAASVRDIDEALAREVEAQAGVQEGFAAILNVVVTDLREQKRVPALQPEVATLPRVKTVIGE